MEPAFYARWSAKSRGVALPDTGFLTRSALGHIPKGGGNRPSRADSRAVGRDELPQRQKY